MLELVKSSSSSLFKTTERPKLRKSGQMTITLMISANKNSLRPMFSTTLTQAWIWCKANLTLSSTMRKLEIPKVALTKHQLIYKKNTEN